MVQGLLRAPIINLGIEPGLHGYVQGNVQFALTDELTYEIRPIPSLLRGTRRVYGSFGFVLVVEKDTVFQHLQSLEPAPGTMSPTRRVSFAEKYQCVVTTSKGFACRSIRIMLEAINRSYPGTPVFYLGDCDPSGLMIYLQYRFGSRKSALDCPFSSEMHYIGVRLSDIIEPDQSENAPMISIERLHACGILEETCSASALDFLLDQVVVPIPVNEIGRLETLCYGQSYNHFHSYLRPLHILPERSPVTSRGHRRAPEPEDNEYFFESSVQQEEEESAEPEESATGLLSTTTPGSFEVGSRRLGEGPRYEDSDNESNPIVTESESAHGTHVTECKTAVAKAIAHEAMLESAYAFQTEGKTGLGDVPLNRIAWKSQAYGKSSRQLVMNSVIIQCSENADYETEDPESAESIIPLEDESSRSLRQMGVRISSLAVESRYLNGFTNKSLAGPPVPQSCCGRKAIGHQAASLALVAAEMNLMQRLRLKCEIEALETISEGALERYIVSFIRRTHPECLPG